MFGNREGMRQRLQGLIEKFRQKGATSPEKAMTIQELGLPPRFEEAMHRRLGRSGIFVEINGKYYLNEERLKQVEEQRTKMGSGGGGGWNSGGSANWYRFVGFFLMLPIGIIIALVLFYFFYFRGGGTYYPGEFLVILLVIFIVLFVVRMLFWSSRRRYLREHWRDSGLSSLSYGWMLH